MKITKYKLLNIKIALFLTAILYFFTQCNPPKAKYIYNAGETFGTYYHITYQSADGKDYQNEIKQKFAEFDASLSTYNPHSIISRINGNDTSVVTDAYFDQMYQMAKTVSEKTGGAFDITVAPLVNAWGFGYGNHDRSKIPDIDTILPFVGYEKIKLENHKLLKENLKTRLDASALAKGQGVDVIAKLLEDKGCRNYMVEIGGEVHCKGVNNKGEIWHIGIDKPIDNPSTEDEQLESIVELKDASMATSGNYRQFYYKDGKKYAHEINPHTGMPVVHNLLSVSVIAPTCMQADAYATAFMILGVKKSLEVCNSIPGMECYLIYSGENGIYKIAQTKGFEKYLLK